MIQLIIPMARAASAPGVIAPLVGLAAVLLNRGSTTTYFRSFKLHQIAGHADHGQVRLQGIGAEEDDVSPQAVGLPADASARPMLFLLPCRIPGNQLVATCRETSQMEVWLRP